MFAFNAFGLTNDLALTTLGDSAVWCNHLFQVYAKAPTGLADRAVHVSSPNTKAG